VARVWLHIDEETGKWTEWEAGTLPSRISCFNFHFLNQFVAWTRYLSAIDVGGDSPPDFLEKGDNLQLPSAWEYSTGFFRRFSGDWDETFGPTSWFYTGDIDFTSTGSVYSRPSGGTATSHASYTYEALADSWTAISANIDDGENLQAHVRQKLLGIRTVYDACKACVTPNISSTIDSWKQEYDSGGSLIYSAAASTGSYEIKIVPATPSGQLVYSSKSLSITPDGFTANYAAILWDGGFGSDTVSGLVSPSGEGQIGVLDYTTGTTLISDYYPTRQYYSTTPSWRQIILPVAIPYNEIPEDFLPPDGLPVEDETAYT